MHFDHKKKELIGSTGSIAVSQNDEVTLKLVMLIEGECEGLGPIRAADKFGYSKQRYFQLRTRFLAEGASALRSKLRGPKRKYRQTSELVRQVIRHRFLDPQSSPEVIAQKIRQTGMIVSTRTVERVISDYGLQKKTLQPSPKVRARKDPKSSHSTPSSRRTR